MPISCLLPCADPGIFVRGGGGGGGVHVNLTKKSSDSVVSFFFFFLVLRLVYRSQMVNLKEKYHFQGSGGVQIFPGWVQLFLGRGGGGGSNCLFPVETQITCDFPGGEVRTPCPHPPSGSALGCDLFSFPIRKMMRSRLALVLVFLQLRYMFSVESRNKIVS